MEYGLLTLIPPAIIMFLAIKTRKCFFALLTGAVSASIIMYGPFDIGAIFDILYGVVMDGDVQWLIMLTGTIGSLLYLFKGSNGLAAFTRIISKYATNKRRTMVASFIVGIVIFIGEMTNIMTVGATMEKLYDKHKIPREMLAYMMDSTGVPVTILVPFTDWAAFFITIFMAQPEVVFQSASKIANYATLVPFMFYPMAAVLITFLLVIEKLPRLGAMKKAWERVETTGKVYSDASAKFNVTSSEIEKEDKPARMINFLLPLVTLIAISIIMEDVLVGILAAIILISVMTFVQRILTFDEITDLCVQGFTNMVPMIIIIIGAFMAKDALILIGLPEFVIYYLEDLMSPQLLPAIVFFATALLAFITGSSWGVPAIVVTIVVPLAAAVGASMPLTLAAILSGAAFGGHACFYADITVFTSAVAKIDNTEHAFSQIPYALISAGIALIAYVICGFVMV